MFPSNHSGWEPHFLFHYQAKTHEMARMFVGFRDKELSLYSRCCEKYIWAMGREKGVHKIMPYAIFLSDLLSRKEKVGFTSKEVSNAYTMCEMFFSEGTKGGAAPEGKMSWELRGSDSRQCSAPHTHVRELDRPTDGDHVQPRVLIVRKYHGDEVGLRASHRWPGPGDDR